MAATSQPTFPEIDRRRIAEVRRVLKRKDPLEWTSFLVKHINDLSDHTLVGALEKGKLIDFGIRTGGIRLTEESFAKNRLHIQVRLAKMWVRLATHKSNCAEAPPR